MNHLMEIEGQKRWHINHYITIEIILYVTIKRHEENKCILNATDMKLPPSAVFHAVTIKRR